ncbi:MAG: hypothetical protein Q9226_000859 [Calogaya cf. arnoldii]
MNFSDNGGGNEARTPRPIAFRPNLRQASVIIPKTGQRVRRAVTLGLSPSLPTSNGNAAASENSPLLGGPKAHPKPSDAPRLFLRVSRRLYHNAIDFATSRTGKGVLKCSIAYLLGSLATFVPAIAAMLGQQDGKHMVATITVYFHPARSQGSMFEAG